MLYNLDRPYLLQNGQFAIIRQFEAESPRNWGMYHVIINGTLTHKAKRKIGLGDEDECYNNEDLSEYLERWSDANAKGACIPVLRASFKGDPKAHLSCGSACQNMEDAWCFLFATAEELEAYGWSGITHNVSMWEHFINQEVYMIEVVDAVGNVLQTIDNEGVGIFGSEELQDFLPSPIEREAYAKYW